MIFSALPSLAVRGFPLLSYGFLVRPEKPKVFILGILAAILIVMLRKIKKLIK